MRKATKLVATAFINREPHRTVNNRRTDGTVFYLHDNAIAWWNDTHLNLTLAGWGTVTTRDCLNGILHLMKWEGAFFQQKHEQYYGVWVKSAYHAEKPIDPKDVITISRDDLDLEHMLRQVR